ncbi:hypothetical protein BH09PLA1_BH09PLA1_04300 [soil metagenome]
MKHPWVTVKNSLRTKLDKTFPASAKQWRRARDWWIQRNLKAYPTPFGFSLIGDPDLASSRSDQGEIAVISALLKSGRMFVDIGANVGLFSVLARSLGAATIAVEPDVSNVRLLRENLLRNGFPDTEVRQVAVGDATGIVKMYGGGQGASLQLGWGGISSTYDQLVSMTTLDRVLSGCDACDGLVIKIDVEGYEARVCVGAAKTLQRTDTVWIVENTLQSSDAENSDYLSVFRAFWESGYESYSIGARAFVGSAQMQEWIARGSTGFWNQDYVFFRPGSRDDATLHELVAQLSSDATARG